MASTSIRALQDGDAVAVARLLDRCFGALERWTPQRVADAASVSAQDPGGFWVAFHGSRVVGCVRVHGVPRPDSAVVRELAVDDPSARPSVEALLDVALEHLAGHGRSRVRASTPMLPPYPDAYERRGFRPTRRALTLDWDLTGPRWSPRDPPDHVVNHDAAGYSPETIAELYVEGMRPYWDWYIDERGGIDRAKRRVATHFAAPGAMDGVWLVAERDGQPVGFAGAAVEGAEADLEGVYVLPAHRGHGAGSALMAATLEGVAQRAPRLVVPETMSFLESDVPSIRLYKRSGARVRAEYLHLEMVQPAG